MFGWLVVNGFLASQKFEELYGFLSRAAARRGITLKTVTTVALTAEVEAGFREMALPDFVLFWDKDVYLARRLEQEGLRVFNSAEAIALCDNKILTALCLRGAVPTPRTVPAPKTFEGVGYTDTTFLSEAIRLLGLPLVMKEAYGSFGQQVYLVHSEEEAVAILGRMGSRECLMQECIASSYGRDVRINVVGDRVISAMLRYSETDFRSNITAGGRMQAYEPSEVQKAAALAACRAIGLDFAGVDVLFGPDGAPIVCEVNSNPHFKSSYDCTGVDMSEAVMDHIRETLT